MKNYDVIIVGGGSGGYYCAEKIKEFDPSKSVLIIEKDKIGGVCLNYGCIPTKSFISVAEIVENFKISEKFGIKSSYTLDFLKVFERKEKIVKILQSGLYKKLLNSGIDIIFSKAHLNSTSIVETENGEKFQFKNLVIATGSEDTQIPFAPFDGENILNSKESLSLKEIPSKIVIVGGGVIGCEFATYFSIFGSDVTIVEMFDTPLPSTGNNFIKENAKKILQKNGIKFLGSTKVISVDKMNKNLSLSTGESLDFDKLIVAVGRKPVVGVEVEILGVEKDQKGFIKTDRFKRTNVENIFATGDVTEGPMLAHKGYYDGYIAAKNICGLKSERMDYCFIPYSVFTIPPMSHSGKSEDDLKNEGTLYKILKANYAENGRAATYEARSGEMRVYLSKEDKILGVDIFGKDSDIIIHQLLPLIQNGIDYKKLKETVFVHPTLSEIVTELK
uniref:NAD(P)/FAD-dependent oxidoreductase n=1 Tax=candidate division WOR-3 bacterium TaxID=2052148 RepID=A0A7C3J5W0_UNCW3